MNIIVNCERMKHKHTGLYSFCLSLSKALFQEKQKTYPNLKVYIPTSAKSVIGSLDHITQKNWHKLYNPAARHCHLWHETSQDGDYFPYRAKAKKVLTIHDLNYLHDDSKSTAKKQAFLNGLQKQIDHSDYITTISNYSLQDLQHVVDLRSKPIKVIYNGSNKPPATTFNKPPYIKDDLKFFFTIGTIVRKKNFHVLPSLLVGNDYHLVIAGEIVSKDYYHTILDEANKLGVADRLILTGGITENDKWWFYQHMEAFFFPSIAEGFGLPVIEAMNYGKPVLLSKATSLPEVGGDHAYYFTSFDPVQMQHDLTDAIKDYHSNPGKPQQIKDHAASFNWNYAAKQYWEVYAELLNLQLLAT